MLRSKAGKGVSHHMSFFRTFPGKLAAMRDISCPISAHTSRDASPLRFALRVSGCLGSDHGVFGRDCLDSMGSCFSLLL